MTLRSPTKELCLDRISKDKRELRVIEHIEKTHFDPFEGKIELEILKDLYSQGISVPQLVSPQSEGKVLLRYYKGIRVFNFLVFLQKIMDDYHDQETNKQAVESVARRVLQRCEQQQKTIQKILFEKYKDNPELEVYPETKITEMIDYFFGYYPERFREIDKWQLLKELNSMYQEYEKHAKVPFRDSTTKNMILDCDKFFAGNFLKNRELDDEERKNYIKKMFENGELEKTVDRCQIIDSDFSSCVHRTTPSDDVISLKFHERTEPYFDIKKLEIWNDVHILSHVEPEKSIAATFVIRFLRFGGRKALWYLRRKRSFDIRFKYDNPSYYFKRMPIILREYWQNADDQLSTVISFFGAVEKTLALTEPSHYSDAIPDGIEKKLYSDIYPY